MFKVNHLFGGNGALPSLGGGTTSLASALAGVERAEAALAAARALARSAAKREGVAVRGLFEDSRFILRETGERWTDQARREGERTMADIFGRTVETDSKDPSSAFYHLAKRLMQPGALRRQQAAGDHHELLSERILAAARRAKSSGDDERPLPPADSVAGRILAAGARRRTPTGGHQDD
jgi:hypothetical protein